MPARRLTGNNETSISYSGLKDPSFKLRENKAGEYIALRVIMTHGDNFVGVVTATLVYQVMGKLYHL